MRYLDSVLEAVGRTPLVRLSRVAGGLPVTLLAKAEQLNPGGSIKDRIALAMIEDAEARGALTPGATIIEATAGNTGVGLALVAACKGYRCIFVLPDKMSEDKVNLLRAYGAEVVITPTAVAPDSPESYNGVADRLAREIPGAFRPNQFANRNNPEAHYLSTGPEIWEDTDGKVDVLVAGMGTCGTISGTGGYLKMQNPDVWVIGADPEGSILSGDSPHAYKVEGIGEDMVPATFNRQVVDEFIRVSDQESFATARRLAREEGLLVGGSAGTAVAAALKYAERLVEHKVIVVVLPDTGRNYLSKIFSDSWMEDNGFVDEPQDRVTAADVLASKRTLPSLVAVEMDDPLMRAIAVMSEQGISQLPVLKGGLVVGAVTETATARALHDAGDPAALSVGDAMGRCLPEVDVGTEVSEVYRLLLSGNPGVVVLREGHPQGFLSRIDLVSYWAGGDHAPARGTV
ncbi:MAG: cystathionine beta-synthase [Actinobacteria bacterium RBG_16_64_13]|nr:MAG: cystathionine beta-synthase [Actinobacteria bacterium RBG_16_64_13]